MTNPHDEYHKLVRMMHDKLWLESHLGNTDAPAMVWPEVEALASPGMDALRQQLQRPPSHPQPQSPAAQQPPPPPQSAPPHQPAPPPKLVRISDCSPEPGDHLDADSGLSKQERLTQLWPIARDCTRCELHQGRQTVVFADGDAEADLLFIGEGPGYDEDRQGVPFVGRAGQLLNRIIAAIGMRREEVFIANIVKCHPPRNRDPQPVEAKTCLPFLLAQIEIVQPKVICLLGRIPLQYMTNERSIMRSRGRWFEYNGIPMMATYHPAFLLRNENEKRNCWEDMKQVKARIDVLNSGGE